MLDFSRFTEQIRSTLHGGAGLHRSALLAAHAGRHERAERLFEAAAGRYRRDLEVEPLARLRVHQMMARVLAGRDPSSDAQRCLEVERRLVRLDRIESPHPPFTLVDARSVLASWIRPGFNVRDSDVDDSQQRTAA